MGTIFLRGLKRIVFWDVCPTLTVLRFQQTKEIRPFYIIIIMIAFSNCLFQRNCDQRGPPLGPKCRGHSPNLPSRYCG